MITFTDNLGGITLIYQNDKFNGWFIGKIAKGLYRVSNPNKEKGWIAYSYKAARQCAISHLSKAS